MASSPASYAERLGVGAAVAPGVGLEDGVGDGVMVAVVVGVRVGSTDGIADLVGGTTATGTPDPGGAEHAAMRITRAAPAADRVWNTAGV
jgi:hypothetical protein